MDVINFHINGYAVMGQWQVSMSVTPSVAALPPMRWGPFTIDHQVNDPDPELFLLRMLFELENCLH